MKLSLISPVSFCLAIFLWIVTNAGASVPPSEELRLWQDKYPGYSMVSVTRNLDITVSVSGNDLEINQKTYRELIVLTDNASSLAESREYFNSHYTLNKFEAFTLVPDGKKYRKITVPKYTKTAVMSDNVFYDDQVAYNYTFPAVGKGAKLVIKTDATTRYPYVPVVFDFAGSIPYENMSITMSIPHNVKINYHLFGMDTAEIRFSKQTKGDRIIYSWQANDFRAYDLDDLAPDWRYVIPHLIIQIASYTIGSNEKPVMGSLKDQFTYNYGHVNKLQKEPSAEIRRLADSVTTGCTTDRDKVRSIYKWVQHHIKYVAIEDGDNGLVPDEADNVLKRRYGDCKGKTSLIVSMIRAKGLKASFAWVGSRERPYKYSELSSVVNDDHMIAVWWDNDNPVILDGTTFTHHMEDIPAFIQGKECLIEKGSNDYMLYTIPVAPARNNLVNDSICMEVKGDSIIGSGVITFMGENKAKAMYEFEGKDTSQYSGALKRLLTRSSNKHLIRSVSISDINNTEQPFSVAYKFVLPDFITSANENKYVSLHLCRFLNQTFIKEDRQIPVESKMSVEYRVISMLKIPEGFRIQRVPDSTSFTNPLFGFSEKYSLNDNYVTLNSSVTVDFQLLYGAEMHRFRNMLSQLNRNYQKSLALEKIQ